MKIFFLPLLMLLSTHPVRPCIPARQEDPVIGLLQQQTDSWNRGDLRSFMDTYWHSDSLIFLGPGGATYGWERVWARYRKRYPDQGSMGRLNFRILKIERPSPDYRLVAGLWHLARKSGDLRGSFSLLIRKFPSGWKIILDHSD